MIYEFVIRDRWGGSVYSDEIDMVDGTADDARMAAIEEYKEYVYTGYDAGDFYKAESVIEGITAEVKIK